MSLDDIRHSSFFAGENPKHLEQIITNSLKEKEDNPEPPPLPELPNPVAEMQPVPTVAYKEVA